MMWVWRTNYVMAKFGACSANIRSSMFRTYCTNYYYSPLWKLDSSTIYQLYTAWRKCMYAKYGLFPIEQNV